MAIGCSRLPCIFRLKIVHLAYENVITDPSVGLWGKEKEKIPSFQSLASRSLLLGCLSIFEKEKKKQKNNEGGVTSF